MTEKETSCDHDVQLRPRSERTPIFEVVGGLERGKGDNHCEKLLNIIGRTVLKRESMARC